MRVVVALLACIGVAAVTVALWFARHGVSARPDPSAFETAVARKLRAAAIPRNARALRNPVPGTGDAVQAGLEHFANHCAVCHANDGSGDTDMGHGLYPRAPDMRQPATQTLSDGALFYIIENGVRLTGMPAWGTGTPDGERASWQLVHAIRKLPTLTEEERDRMTAWNPKTPAELRAEQAERDFLAGGETVPSSAPAHKHGGRK